jgi:hypothetical protein
VVSLIFNLEESHVYTLERLNGIADSSFNYRKSRFVGRRG